MKFLSIIPARGGSKGIPLKNIVKLNKKPLLYYTLKASLNSKLIDRTIVSTDNQKISNYAQKLCAEVIARPKNYPAIMLQLNLLQFIFWNIYPKKKTMFLMQLFFYKTHPH